VSPTRPEWLQLVEPRFSLAAGAEATLEIRVEVPEGAAGGRYPLSVVVFDVDSPDEIHATADTLTLVLADAGIWVTASAEELVLVRNAGTLGLVVSNRLPDAFRGRLAAIDQPELIRARFEPPRIDGLAPGDDLEVTLSVDLGRRPQPGRRTFRVALRDDRGQVRDTAGPVAYEPIPIPVPWIPFVVAGAVAVAAAIVLLIVFARPEPPADVWDTALWDQGTWQ